MRFVKRSRIGGVEISMGKWGPKMWDEEEPDSPKAKSQKNEARLSEEVGFNLTRGSGNQPWPFMKGDGQTKSMMFELKETEAARIVIGTNVISKLCREARSVGKDPVLVLSAYGMPEPLPKDWVCVPVELFHQLVSHQEDE